MDLNYQIVTPSDDKYGGKLEGSQRWNGMVGMVLDNVSNICIYFFYKNLIQIINDMRPPFQMRLIFVCIIQDADMIAADLTLTKDRYTVLDFSPPLMSFPVTILTKLVSF